MASDGSGGTDMISDPEILTAIAEDQGDLEMEMSCTETAEADLYTGHTNCKKDPSHDGFIPVTSFNRDHLPEPFKDDKDVIEAIETIAFLTVRLRVYHISHGRPQYFPGTSTPYPFAKYAGKKVLRLGTGLIDQGFVPLSRDDDATCPCNECKNSQNPAKVWGEVVIMTSIHVLYDQAEVKDSKVELFYDDDQTRKEKVVILEGYKVQYNDQYKDSCFLSCPTHDIDLLNKLQKETSNSCGSISAITQKHAKTPDSLAVVVSHPHGASKKISVGQWTDKEEQTNADGNQRVRYTYTTSTCQGSSGAPVCLVGGWGSEADQGWWRLYPVATHCGGSRIDCNKSGDAYIAPFQ